MTIFNTKTHFGGKNQQKLTFFETGNKKLYIFPSKKDFSLAQVSTIVSN
jgi:hypothetical protein